jgi:tetratricopeptide (TPR) repeat protein
VCGNSGCTQCRTWNYFYVTEKGTDGKTVETKAFCSIDCERAWIDPQIQKFLHLYKQNPSMLSEQNVTMQEWFGREMGYLQKDIYSETLWQFFKKTEFDEKFQRFMKTITPFLTGALPADGSKCDKCDSPGLRSISNGPGEQSNLCMDCTALSLIEALIKSSTLENGLLYEAVMMDRAGRFDQAAVSFEKIAKKTCEVLEYYLKSLADSLDDEDLDSSKLVLLFDLVDTCSYAQKKTAGFAYKACEDAIDKSEPVLGITAVEHFVKVIQSHTPFTYVASQDAKDGPEKDVSLVDIPRPKRILEMCELPSIVDFDLIRSKRAIRAKRSMIAYSARYQSDLVSLAVTYHLLGRSLVFLGRPRQALISKGEEIEEKRKALPTDAAGHPILVIHTGTEALARRREALVRRLVPQIDSLAIELFVMTRECLEMLPAEQHRSDACRRYGSTLFEEGVCYRRQGKLGEATASFQKALKIYENREEWPPPPNAELGMADCHLYIAECLVAQGKNEEAKNHIGESLKISTILGVKDNVERANALLKRISGDQQRYTC